MPRPDEGPQPPGSRSPRLRKRRRRQKVTSHARRDGTFGVSAERIRVDERIRRIARESIARGMTSEPPVIRP